MCKYLKQSLPLYSLYSKWICQKSPSCFLNTSVMCGKHSSWWMLMAQTSEWCFGTRATGTCAFSPAAISAGSYTAKDHTLVGQRATRGQLAPADGWQAFTKDWEEGLGLQRVENVLRGWDPCEQRRPPGMTDQSRKLSLRLLLKAEATGPEPMTAFPVQVVHRDLGKKDQRGPGAHSPLQCGPHSVTCAPQCPRHGPCDIQRKMSVRPPTLHF